MIKEIKFRDYFHYLRPHIIILTPPSEMFTFKMAELILINFLLVLFLSWMERCELCLLENMTRLLQRRETTFIWFSEISFHFIAGDEFSTLKLFSLPALSSDSTRQSISQVLDLKMIQKPETDGFSSAYTHQHYLILILIKRGNLTVELANQC